MIKFLKQLFSGKEQGHEQQLSFNESKLEEKNVGKILYQDESTDFNIATDNKEMEIKVVEEKEKEEVDEKSYSDMPSYEPALDLRDYKYPDFNLFEDDINNSIFQRLSELNLGKGLPILWSKDDVICKDLTSLRNILVAGSQATGKSTFLHQIITSLLMCKHPSQLKLVLADCKGVELNIYSLIENHFLAKLLGEEEAIITDTKKALYTMNALCIEMDSRYNLLKEAGARNIKEYNEKFTNRNLDTQKGHQYLPFIVTVIDDLGAFALYDNEITSPLIRLIDKGHTVGIFNIINLGQLKKDSMNIFLSLVQKRAVFRLNNKEEYRKFFDTVRLDRFLKEGEFLFNDEERICKGMNIMIERDQIEKIVDFIGNQRGYPQPFLLPKYLDEKDLEGRNFDASDRDPLFEEAARLIVQNQVGSTSLIQRRMKLGYNRVGRLMDQLEAAGVVGPNQGSKAREVLIKTEADLQESLQSLS